VSGHHLGKALLADRQAAEPLLRSFKLTLQDCSAVVQYVPQVLGKRDFTLTSVQPFTKTGQFEVHCRCITPEVRQKWITALNRVLPPNKFFHKQ
jgi:hypothetical protein